MRIFFDFNLFFTPKEAISRKAIDNIYYPHKTYNLTPLTWVFVTISTQGSDRITQTYKHQKHRFGQANTIADIKQTSQDVQLVMLGPVIIMFFAIKTISN